MPDPLAIQIGSTLPFRCKDLLLIWDIMLQSKCTSLNQITDPAPNSDYGTALTFNERPKQCISHCIQAALILLSHKPQHIPANKWEIN
jgi:hypothetical protein